MKGTDKNFRYKYEEYRIILTKLNIKCQEPLFLVLIVLF